MSNIIFLFADELNLTALPKSGDRRILDTQKDTPEML